jgi:hypothetical protein
LRTESRQNMDSLRSRMDRQFLWILGIMITMWLSIAAMWITSMLAVLNKLGS